MEEKIILNQWHPTAKGINERMLSNQKQPLEAILGKTLLSPKVAREIAKTIIDDNGATIDYYWMDSQDRVVYSLFLTTVDRDMEKFDKFKIGEIVYAEVDDKLPRL